MSKTFYFPHKGFLSRFISQILTSSIFTFVVFIIITYLFIDGKIWIFLLITFLFYCVLSFLQSILYIDSICFKDDNTINVNVLKYNKKIKTIEFSIKDLKIEEIHNPVGITSMLGNYLLIYNKGNKVFKQYLIAGWKVRENINELSTEIELRKIQNNSSAISSELL